MGSERVILIIWEGFLSGPKKKLVRGEKRGQLDESRKIKGRKLGGEREE